MVQIKIGDRLVGMNHEPFIIAELSGNHNQSIDRALAIVDAAAEAGATAIKLQTYTADTITIDHRGGLFDISDEASPWFGKNLYQLYQEAHTPWDWHQPIFERAKKHGLLAFSSPFDETAVDFLEDLKVPAYKIASFESNHHPLLRKVARTGKPVIISSGASKLHEIHESVKILQNEGCDQIAVLKCTSTYPASPKNSNLLTIPIFQEIFKECVVGLSDHTLGIGVSVASVALGARVIEKHLTLSRADGGVDSSFSLEPAEFAKLVEESGRAATALGEVQLDSQKSEEKSRRFKRSIYVVERISKGDELTTENIRVIRPGDGLEPKLYENVLGMKAWKDMERGSPLSW